MAGNSFAMKEAGATGGVDGAVVLWSTKELVCLVLVVVV